MNDTQENKELRLYGLVISNQDPIDRIVNRVMSVKGWANTSYYIFARKEAPLTYSDHHGFVQIGYYSDCIWVKTQGLWLEYSFVTKDYKVEIYSWKEDKWYPLPADKIRINLNSIHISLCGSIRATLSNKKENKE